MTVLYIEFNTIEGSDGANDILFGSELNDQIFGKQGDDTLGGGDGDDIDLLFGGLGNDTLKGSVGVDYYFFQDPNARMQDIGPNKIQVTSFEGIDIIENFEQGDDIYIADTVTDSSSGGTTQVPFHSATNPVNPPIFIEYKSVLGLTTLVPRVVVGSYKLNDNLKLGGIHSLHDSFSGNTPNFSTINHLNTGIFDTNSPILDFSGSF
ncbi:MULTISPECIES: hypothetical protein [Nostocales]|uniref:Calcium-binding protein n=3 Tax=Nostocales TaxID=1161 RepID=A0A0C1N7G9_9CYAN|nr:hypothetical protein [Tolypothrix bouteillei]KAF3883811.1 hypothetical protein DA73_0400039545 [Tolypothrix bouteillei VB521301]